MKKIGIKVEYSEEKLMALNTYLEKKETDLSMEIEDYMDKLYEKFVPSQVREFIETKEEATKKKPKIIKSQV